jgi:hypothetical protein
MRELLELVIGLPRGSQRTLEYQKHGRSTMKLGGGPAELADRFRRENGQKSQTGHTPHIGENTTPKFTKNNMYDGA